ncbi:MAG: tetratricopeptide repeat protein [Candidatus Solibacter usitatus]|nr:tetratricopeptide repeat protein [Candidatus Solibacter usitatus]
MTSTGRLAAVAVAALALNGCARRTAAIPAQTPPRTAMRATLDRQVRNAVVAGEGDQEVRILRQRLAIAPEANELRVQLAGKYKAAGFPDLALEHIRNARLREPRERALLLEEVRLLRDQDLAGEAASTLQRYLEPAGGADPELRSWLGIALDEAGKLDQGERAHREALAASPESDVLHNNLGYNLLQQRRYAEAASEFEAALRINRRSETARSNLARAMAERPAGQDPTAAVAHWTTAVDAAAAHSNLAAAYIEQAQYQKAREEIGTALRYKRAYGPALNNLRLAAELDGRPAEITADTRERRWHRFTALMKRAFTKKETEAEARARKAKDPRTAASR